MFRVGVVPGFFLLALAGCTATPSAGSSSGQSSMIEVAFKKDQSYRYHYQASMNGSMTLGQAPASPIKADSSADATWKVVSVDASGNTTIDLTLTNLKTSVTGSMLPGSTTTTTTTTTSQHFQFQVARTGEIVSGGGTAGPPSGFASGQGLGMPGTDQFLAVLPGHSVKPGDTWTKTFSRPDPTGQGGTITYTTENRFLRYDNLASGRAAVIQTTSTVPLDITVGLGQAAAGIGAAPSPPPVPIGVPMGGQVHIQGTSSTESTTWFDVKTDQVERMRTIDTMDQTTTLVGITGLPSPPTTQGPPGPVPPGAPVFPGSEHFAGRQTFQLDLLS
jgi:hypothetical protein